MEIVSLMAATLPSMLRDAQRPRIDYHQHLLSPCAKALVRPSAEALGSLPTTFTARDLIPLLDAASIERALLIRSAI